MIRQQRKEVLSHLTKLLSKVSALFLLIAFSIFAFQNIAWSQAASEKKIIKGHVTNEKQEPAAGASVTIKGTSIGTTVDTAGNFTLSVRNNAVLLFSFVGYEPKEVKVANSTTINIQLTLSTSALLDQVVVVGYGTQKRKDITGSVVSLDKQRLEDMPNTNFAQALEGALPGVSVVATGGGAEGNNVSILIRGQNSITASTAPLIILDGIPYNGTITDITPSDIASIDILKDASAAAIYGSRGSNGVILITTKKGSFGKPVVSYNVYTALEKIANLPPVLSPDQFYQFKLTREGQSSITPSEQAVYDSKNFPNWLNQATQTGLKTQHSLSIRGGNNAIKYYASVNYLDAKGVAVNDHFRQLSTRVNLEATVTNWLTYGNNTELTFNNRSGLPANFNGNGNGTGAYFFDPLTLAYDSIVKQLVDNPMSATLAQNTDYTYKLFTNNYLQVKIPFIKGLGYRLNTGIEYQERDINTYYGRNTFDGLKNNGDLSSSNSNINDYTIENILTYNRVFNKHSIDFTSLYSYEQDVTNSNSISAQNFPNDVLTIYQANVALAIKPSASYAKRTLVSQMARLNYSYAGRYLLTVTGRRDGSSVFGIDNKFGFFPSVAVGWNIANESFMKNNKAISNLKLRLSYGSNGNQAISPYQTLAALTTRSYIDGNITQPGYVPATLANPNLHWETTNTANFGLDYGFLNGRIQGSLDLYKANTHDLLLNRSISPVQGINTITQNIGKTSNQGIELSLNTINIQRGVFTWSTSVNVSSNRNRIISLYGDGKNDTLNQWFSGHPIQVNFGYAFNGIYQLNDDTVGTPQGNVHPGDAKIRDINKDSVINSNDRTIISNNIRPKLIWGMANTFKYKAFTLYIFVQGQEGASMINPLMNENGVGSGVHFNTIIKNWWTTTNPSNVYWANSLTSNKLGVPIVQNSSYVRVKDISLGYDFLGKVLQRSKLSKLKIYIEARNLFTLTKWIGLDPELSNQTTIPLQKEYVVGLNVSL